MLKTELDIQKEFAIGFAKKLQQDYAEEGAVTVQEIINCALRDGRFENETEMLGVWGRLHKIAPLQK